MTANTQLKAEPKWKTWLRRLRRQTPFWRKRLEDRVELPETDWSPTGNAVMLAVVCLAFTGLFVSALALVVVGPIFHSPGFLEYGLADPIGRGLADVCLAGGSCELPVLLSGAALAVVLLVAMVLLVTFPLVNVINARHDGEEVTEYELLEALTVLDERIVRLRADLVLAGVLKLSPEELEEAEYARDLLQERFSDQQAQWVDPDPDALADDPYLEALLDRALALTDTQRMVVAGEIERLLAEYGRPVSGR